jgi:hypothetical protein
MNILTRHYAKDTHLVTRCIAGETIIVPVRSNVGDLNSIYTLNEVGTMIWELIDGKNSAVQIIEAICRDYEVGPEEASKDTVFLLESLEEAGLIAPLTESNER